MAVVLLKNLTNKANIKEQQDSIISYAKKHSISIDTTEIDTSDSSRSLEERTEFKGFLRSLQQNCMLVVYDFWVLSENVDELVKICECLLQRNISLYVANKKEIISVKSSALYVLHVLSKERKTNKALTKNTKLGRPKGRMSQSKFDTLRPQIIKYLELDYPVSKIACMLKVSRTSLKDYINSRNLKELACSKKELLGAVPNMNEPKNEIKKCELIAKQNKGEQKNV